MKNSNLHFIAAAIKILIKANGCSFAVFYISHFPREPCGNKCIPKARNNPLLIQSLCIKNRRTMK